MGVAVDDPLSKRATLMRESLQKSQTITDRMVSILGSFDHRLSALESAMRPTQVRSSTPHPDQKFSTWPFIHPVFLRYAVRHLDSSKILRDPFSLFFSWFCLILAWILCVDMYIGVYFAQTL